MKALSIFILVVCLAISVASLHFLSRVNHMEDMDDYNLVRLQEGQVLQVMQTGRFWEGFPSIPITEWKSLLNAQAALVVVALLVCILPSIQNQKKTPYNAIAFFCLLFGIVPVAAGQWFLIGNVEADTAVRHLTFMGLGVLYTTIAGLLFVTLSLLQKKIAATEEKTA